MIRIEAEDYRQGGQGVAYNDSTPTENLGGAYRNEGVDLEVSFDATNTPGKTGYNVCWVVAGEWTSYSVTVPTAGTYTIVARVASALTGTHRLSLTLGSQNLGTASFNGTGGWQNWTNVTLANVTLPAGTSELRIDYLTTGLNLNYIDFLPVVATGTVGIGQTAIFVSEGAGTVSVPVVRDGGTTGTIVVEYQTSAGSATAGADYASVNGGTASISLGDGVTSNAFSIGITDDGAVEAIEQFGVGIQSANIGTPRTGQVSIVDNDGATRFLLSDSTFNVNESDGTATITVVRAGPNNRTSKVNYATSSGSAITGEDYTAVSGKLTFAPSEIVKTFTVPIRNDSADENNESFTVALSKPSGGRLDSPSTATVNIIDNDSGYTRTTVISGLNAPTAFDWIPNGRNLLIAEKAGVVRVVKDGVLQGAPLLDINLEVNNRNDRGLLSLAIHPDFANNPYLYLAYTYDPPETASSSGLASPDGEGNRPSRVLRVTLATDANGNLSVVPGSQTVILGKNSLWQYTSRPDANSTDDLSIPASGIVGPTITAPTNLIDPGSSTTGQDYGISNIRDYLATDSLSHSIGDLRFAFEGGRYVLYVSNGDGTSYNFVDTRSQRVQDINNLSGKLLRIDPLTGQGLADNPFFTNDGVDNNRDKVFQLGLRNPFRVALDPVTGRPVIGDVGWTRWEELNSADPGANFGWPYYEGGSGTSLANQDYQKSADAARFIPPSPTASILGRSHSTDNARAILMGDFLTRDQFVFGDIVSGELFVAQSTVTGSRRTIASIQSFDNLPFTVDLAVGPDNALYGANLVDGTIVRWA
jgi:glucose/arabinose dehydrogenase